MFNFIIDNLPERIKEYASDFDPYKTTERVAEIQRHNISIQLNLCCNMSCDDNHEEYFPAYEIRLKGNDNGYLTWAFAGYPEDIDTKYAVSVDFDAPDWKTQLETDMRTKLDMIVEQMSINEKALIWDNIDEGLCYLYERMKDEKNN